jgi:hypothetical protein
VHLDDDPLFEASDTLADTLLAAQRAIEALAADALPFAAQLRIHRESTRRAREWIREHVDLTPLPAAPGLHPSGPVRDEHTDEILRRTLEPDEGEPLDEGPEGTAEDLRPPTEETGEAPVDPDALVAFDDALPEDDEPTLTLRGADNPGLGTGDGTEHGHGLVEMDDDSSEGLVEIDDAELSALIADDGADDLDDLDDLDGGALALEDAELDSDMGVLELGGDEDVTSALSGDLSNVDDLVSFDSDSEHDDDLVTLGGDDGDLVTLGGDDDLVSYTEDLEGDETLEHFEDDPTPATPQSGTGGDATEQTLVTDLESLVQLQDLLEQEDAALAEDDEEKEPPRGPGAPRARTTLTEEDLGRLGFTSPEELVAPEGSDADPNSDTGSKPRIRLNTPSDHGVRLADPGRGTPAAVQTRTSGGASARLSIPTIRDGGERGPSTRPSAAAIRIDPEGGGAVVDSEEDAPLALGEADDGWDEEGSGLSLGVEEYELVDEDEVEELPEIEPEPAPPPPMPELSGDEAVQLLRRAHAAAEQGDLQSAAQLFSDVLDFDPDNVEAALGRGRVYLDLGDYARAMSDFTVAEDLRPEDAETNSAIGELYYARKDYGRAIEYFNKALDADAGHAMAWFRRGIAHYYRKDYAQAYDDLVKAQKLDDNIRNIRTYIGMVKKKRR